MIKQWFGYRVEQAADHGGIELIGERNVQEDRMVLAEQLTGFADLSEAQKETVIKTTFERAQHGLAERARRAPDDNINHPDSKFKTGGSTAIISIAQGGKLYTAGLGDAVTYKVYCSRKTGEIVYVKRLNAIHAPENSDE